MSLGPSQLPPLYTLTATNSANTAYTKVWSVSVQSASALTTNYLNTTEWSPRNFPMDTFTWSPVQAIINYGYDLYNLPPVTLINANILKAALRLGKITIPKSYQPNQSPKLDR